MEFYKIYVVISKFHSGRLKIVYKLKCERVQILFGHSAKKKEFGN